MPHHAAGYSGNWHGRYETDADPRIAEWLGDDGFRAAVSDLVDLWTWDDPAPPMTLERDEHTRHPAINWRIDQLVTWVALKAYQEYDAVYHHFREGYAFSDPSGRRLTEPATAMTILALKKAAMETSEPPR